MTDHELGYDEAEAVYTSASSTEPTALLHAVEHATESVLGTVDRLDDTTVQQPTLLPGWTRAHVLSHLARNADALVNLLVWARTGVEHPMYASKEDRDADIRKGASRHYRVIAEDLSAAAARFTHAANAMPPWAWSAEVSSATGRLIPAPNIPRMRLLELWVHLADLDYGFGFDDIPGADIEMLLNDAVREFAGRADVPALSVTTTFDDGRSTVWELGAPHTTHQRVSGRPGALLGWLLGRTDTERVGGDAPELPRWR